MVTASVDDIMLQMVKTNLFLSTSPVLLYSLGPKFLLSCFNMYLYVMFQISVCTYVLSGYSSNTFRICMSQFWSKSGTLFFKQSFTFLRQSVHNDSPNISLTFVWWWCPVSASFLSLSRFVPLGVK